MRAGNVPFFGWLAPLELCLGCVTERRALMHEEQRLN